MEAHEPQLSIIIVNWNSATFLRNCLDSVYRVIQQVQFEVIVVDNGSYDGSAEMVRREFPKVIFIQSDSNLGFAGANNLACSRATADVLLFLNPDTLILDSPVPSVMSLFKSIPIIGAVGCRVLNPDGTPQRHYLQALPTLLNQLLDFDLLKRRFPRCRLWGCRAMYEDSDVPIDVEAISASCLFVKRAAFLEVGCFSEIYFMYGEDLDLSFKLTKAGYRVTYLGIGVVIHYWGACSDKQAMSYFAAVLERQSVHKFFRERYGRVHALAFRAVTAIAALVRLVPAICLADLENVGSRKERFSAVRGKWSLILSWALGIKRSVGHDD